MSRLAIISLAFLLVAVSRQGTQADDGCFRLTAAFNFNDNIYLVDGVKYILVNSQLRETDHGVLADEFNGPQGDVDIDAAVVSAKDGYLYFFQGNHYTFYSFWLTYDPEDVSDWNDFFRGGIDAAGTHGGKTYASRGCYYIADGMDEEEKLENLGLPCNLDAAWSMDGDLYVTKGDNAWVMDPAKGVTGPVKLSDILNLTSTSICQE